MRSVIGATIIGGRAHLACVIIVTAAGRSCNKPFRKSFSRNNAPGRASASESRSRAANRALTTGSVTVRSSRKPVVVAAVFCAILIRKRQRRRDASALIDVIENDRETRVPSVPGIMRLRERGSRINARSVARPRSVLSRPLVAAPSSFHRSPDPCGRISPASQLSLTDIVGYRILRRRR